MLKNAVLDVKKENFAKIDEISKFASQVMQAGPTSLERTLELSQRERHVRALVLQGASSEAISGAWAAC